MEKASPSALVCSVASGKFVLLRSVKVQLLLSEFNKADFRFLLRVEAVDVLSPGSSVVIKSHSLLEKKSLLLSNFINSLFRSSLYLGKFILNLIVEVLKISIKFVEINNIIAFNSLPLRVKVLSAAIPSFLSLSLLSTLEELLKSILVRIDSSIEFSSGEEGNLGGQLVDAA